MLSETSFSSRLVSFPRMISFLVCAFGSGRFFQDGILLEMGFFFKKALFFSIGFVFEIVSLSFLTIFFFLYHGICMPLTNHGLFLFHLFLSLATSPRCFSFCTFILFFIQWHIFILCLFLAIFSTSLISIM